MKMPDTTTMIAMIGGLIVLALIIYFIFFRKSSPTGATRKESMADEMLMEDSETESEPEPEPEED